MKKQSKLLRLKWLEFFKKLEMHNIKEKIKIRLIMISTDGEKPRLVMCAEKTKYKNVSGGWWKIDSASPDTFGYLYGLL